MKIALCQSHIIWENKEENFKIAEKYIREADENGAELILFPEMSFTGFSMNTGLTKEADNRTTCFAQITAKKYGIALGFGWVKDCGEKCENHYSVVDSAGNVISDYAKIHPFTYSGEDEYFQGGNEVNTFTLNGVEMSTLICYDLRFPEIFQAVSDKAEVIIVPANWPKRREEHWKILLQARAIENQSYILGINCVGDMDGIYYSGCTSAFAPDGTLLGQKIDEEGILYVEVDDSAKTYREAFPTKRDRNKDLYRNFYV